MILQISLIAIGAYLLLFNAILGIGLNWGRTKRFTALVGQVPARITYAVLGAIILAYGVLKIVDPSLFIAVVG